MERKKVSILIPCYNEEENVVPMSKAVVEMFEQQLPQYDYELISSIMIPGTTRGRSSDRSVSRIRR